MQADEVLLALHALGQTGDRQCRGVGAEQRVRRDHRLGLGEDLVLERNLLEDGLDHEVAAGEIGVVGGGGDARQDLVPLVLGHLAARDGLVEKLPRVVLALLGRLGGDVLEDDVDAVAGADVGDAGAHHAGAEHGDLLSRTRLVAGRSRAAGIDRVQVEPERLDHVLRDLAAGQIDEVAPLDRERGVDVDARALDRRAHDVVRCGHRRALELLAQVGREGGQHAGELRAGRRAAGHPVTLGVPRLHRVGVRLDPFAGLARASAAGVAAISSTRPSSSASAGLVPGALQQHLHQAVGDAEQPDDAHDPAAARKQTEGHLGQAELRLGVVQRDAVVAGQRDLEATAERGAVQRGDDRPAQRLHAPQVGLDLLADVGELGDVLVGHLDELSRSPPAKKVSFAEVMITPVIESFSA